MDIHIFANQDKIVGYIILYLLLTGAAFAWIASRSTGDTSTRQLVVSAVSVWLGCTVVLGIGLAWLKASPASYVRLIYVLLPVVGLPILTSAMVLHVVRGHISTIPLARQFVIAMGSFLLAVPIAILLGSRL